MSRLRLAIAALVVGLLLGLAAAAVAGAPARERSPYVYPDQSLPITFSHQRHAALALQCVVCHMGAVGSEDVRDDHMPDHTICALCHPMQVPNAAELFPPSGCPDCHPGYVDGRPEHCDPMGQPLPDAPPPDPVLAPTARLTFGHKVHVDAGIPCLDCHAGVDQADLATREHLPSMADCMGCHDGYEAPSECTTCHLQGDEGRFLTELGGIELFLPAGRLRPDDHGHPRWLQVHESAARTDEASCNGCHAPQDCLDCHDGVDKRVDLHPADWKMTHGMEAQHRTLDCLACHDVVADCQDCHTEARVTAGVFPSPLSEIDPGNLRFHPVGWGGVVGEIPGPEHHSHQARRSLDTCVTCHTGDEARCIECHSSLTSPHPRSWQEDAGRWRYGQGDGRVCLECHDPGDPNIAAVGR
jgi:hypothetical protein